jgi:hypothetical protein
MSRVDGTLRESYGAWNARCDIPEAPFRQAEIRSLRAAAAHRFDAVEARSDRRDELIDSPRFS